MIDHPWPGNVRELAHVVERCVLLGDGPLVSLGELPPQVREPAAGEAPAFQGEVIAMRELQRRYARWALDQLGGQKARTAERLDVDVKTLNRWIAAEEDEGSS